MDKRPVIIGIEGRVAGGLGRGAQFLALEWVRRELQRKIGLDPFLGTLNLLIPKDRWLELHARRQSFIKIDDPSSGNCPGYIRQVTLEAPVIFYPGPTYLILP